MTRMSRIMLSVAVGLPLTVALVGQTRPQQAPREVAAIQVDARPLGEPGQQQAPAPAIQLEQTNPGVTETTFELAFDTPVSLKQLLSGIAQSAGLNLQMADNIDKKVTVNVKGVALEDTLKAILTPEKLNYRIEDKFLK